MSTPAKKNNRIYSSAVWSGLGDRLGEYLGMHLALVAAKIDCMVLMRYALSSNRGLIMTEQHRKICISNAAYNGNLAMVMYLVEEKGFPFHEERWVTYAAQKGYMDMLEYLDEKRVSYHDIKCPMTGRTCVMEAALYGQLDVLKYLVEEKGVRCSDDIRNGKGETCTMLAVVGGHLDVVGYFVEQQGTGCGDTIRDREGMTCTMKASKRGHIGVLKYLVEKQGAGYGDTVRDRYGMTCTLHCAESGNLQVMKYLVEKGARCGIGLANRYGVTCIKFARWNKELEKYIQSRRWG
jgi:hypothetical protein